MIDIIIIAAVVLIVGSATTYIIIQKKKGVKCIGCSAGGKCGCSKEEHSEQTHEKDHCQCGCTHH